MNLAGAFRQEEAADFKPGQPVERGLKGGESHPYRVRLEAGQYLKVLVEQNGIDVVVTLSGPGGKQIYEVDYYPQPVPESVLAVAETSGDYRLEVQSPHESASAGRYAIKVEELREAAAEDKTRVAATMLYFEAEQLRDQGTEESLRKVVKKCEEALVLYRSLDDPQGSGRALNLMGLTRSRLGDVEKAVESYLQAAPLFRAAGSRWDEARALNNIGTAFWRLGQLQKALEYTGRALRLIRDVGDREIEYAILNTTANVHQTLGEPKEALEYFGRGLELTRAIGNPVFEAVALNNIGATYQDMGEHQQALEYYGQALSLYQKTGNRRSEANTLSNMGVSHLVLGNPQKALEYYARALPLRRATGDRRGEAYTLSNMGVGYAALGDLQKALAHHLQALPLRRAAGDRFGEAYTLNNIGGVYSKLGDQRQALEYQRQSLSLNRDVGSRRGEALTLSDMGDSYLASGDAQRALDHCLEALRLIRGVGNRVDEALILRRIALAQRDLGNLGEARDRLRAALDILESVRTKLAGQDIRTEYFASNQDYYELYIDLLMRMHRGQPSAGYDAAALQASERARARSLLETLTEARADIRRGVDAALLEDERSLQQQLSAKAERLRRLLGGKHTEAEAAGKEVEALLEGYRRVEERIRAASPGYEALTQPRPLAAEEIQRLLDGETMLLEYALGEERSHLWAVTRDSVRSFELPARAEIEAQARRVYDLLTARNRIVRYESAEKRRERAAKADAEYPAAAAALSRIILAPVADQLGAMRLLVVADGALQYLPFAALPLPRAARGTAPTPDYIPLVARHEIVSLPSATTLALMRRELAGRRPAPKEIAVLADPVFEGSDERVRARQPGAGVRATSHRDAGGRSGDSLTRSLADAAPDGEPATARLRRLPFTRREAEAITARARAGQSEKALDFDASRATATDPRLGQYRYVHFATHAVLNARHPELSGIVLSLTDSDGREQDGFLLAHEIYNLDLPAELVVLSGCRTGLGKEVRGEGLVGLTRGFMYAGARRVAVSLWNVNDRSTAELMTRFYEGVLGRSRLSPAAALRRAQLQMWQSGRWRAPYYWGAFILQGEYR